jgi:hypothetical protein
LRVVVYTVARPCPLCDEALAHLEAIRRTVDFDLVAVEIDHDPRLSVRHALRVPVVAVDGREVAYGRIDRAALEAAIRERVLAERSP